MKKLLDILSLVLEAMLVVDALLWADEDYYTLSGNVK